MKINVLVLLLTSLIPLVVGFVWYNKKTFGTLWMKETGMTDEKAKEANLFLIFGLTFVLSFLLPLNFK